MAQENILSRVQRRKKMSLRDRRHQKPGVCASPASVPVPLPSPGFPLRSKNNLLVRFSLVVRANLDRHFAVKPFEKIEQLVRREAAEMPIHQV